MWVMSVRRKNEVVVKTVGSNTKNQNLTNEYQVLMLKSKVVYFTFLNIIFCLTKYAMIRVIKSFEAFVYCLIEFYGISIIVGYLMPNPIFTYILNILVTNTFCRCSQLNDQTVLFLTIQFCVSQQSL